MFALYRQTMWLIELLTKPECVTFFSKWAPQTKWFNDAARTLWIARQRYLYRNSSSCVLVYALRIKYKEKQSLLLILQIIKTTNKCYVFLYIYSYICTAGTDWLLSLPSRQNWIPNVLARQKEAACRKKRLEFEARNSWHWYEHYKQISSGSSKRFFPGWLV